MAIILLNPSIKASIPITVRTPISIPRVVSPERSLWAQMASKASLTDSQIFMALPFPYDLVGDDLSVQYPNRPAGMLAHLLVVGH